MFLYCTVGLDTYLTYLFSICVALGGVLWSWMYYRSDSLYGAWISHVFVDAALFSIGYIVLF
ncbi:MAG: hypothetical protein R3A45_09675 [Bdellovibrionota bacterium]